MSMRAIWKGAVPFGLVSILVNLYPASDSKDVAFHEVRVVDNSPGISGRDTFPCERRHRPRDRCPDGCPAEFACFGAARESFESGAIALSDPVPGDGLVRLGQVLGELGVCGEDLVIDLPDGSHAE